MGGSPQRLLPLIERADAIAADKQVSATAGAAQGLRSQGCVPVCRSHTVRWSGSLIAPTTASSAAPPLLQLIHQAGQLNWRCKPLAARRFRRIRLPLLERRQDCRPCAPLEPSLALSAPSALKKSWTVVPSVICQLGGASALGATKAIAFVFLVPASPRCRPRRAPSTRGRAPPGVRTSP